MRNEKIMTTIAERSTNATIAIPNVHYKKNTMIWQIIIKLSSLKLKKITMRNKDTNNPKRYGLHEENKLKTAF
jgi:hypothetical protein